MRVAGVGALVLALSLLSACSSEPKPVYQDEHHAAAVVERYDSTLEPAKAVLPLVPSAATALDVTDFTQLRLTLGFGTLDGRSSAADRARFWRELPRTATLSGGLLRPVDGRLRERFGFGADDVSWEASYAGGGTQGWVLAFREDLAMSRVVRAVRAKVGVLKGAVVDTADHLVTSAAPPPAEDSWGHDSAVVGLVGQPADATYVERRCLSFDSVFGAGLEDRLAAGPRDALDDLEPLDAFSISYGGQLATVQLGRGRDDMFTRLHLAAVLPPTKPDFATGFARGVADPSTGRLGFQLVRPATAVQLARHGRLPFAICSS